ncbi:hypothetical protein OG410_01535 [Streptomyces sp. NBC_00659]|uniref:hypothetical protein n=1 Tax=Streptomyces sp. NBC_00659 TaxID=2903669 RepID=UPI002E34425C|nr:hypothetical protein [Streptomyces sp. NBC_00659]
MSAKAGLVDTLSLVRHECWGGSVMARVGELMTIRIVAAMRQDVTARDVVDP